MAIKKEKTLDNGASGDYWRITRETYNKLAGHCVCLVALFKDKAHSDAGKPPLKEDKSYTVKVTKQEMAGDRTVLCYTKIKQKAASQVLVKPGFDGTPAEYRVFDPDLADGEDV